MIYNGKILPCKKHGIVPDWVEVHPDNYLKSMGYNLKPVRKLECFRCKMDEEEAKNMPEINAWNEKQAESDIPVVKDNTRIIEDIVNNRIVCWKGIDLVSIIKQLYAALPKVK